MLSRAHSMAAILERMIVLYDRCLEILNRERSDLVAVDFASLLDTLREKDEVLEALRALDRDRLRIQDSFAMIMDQDPQKITLKFLAESLVEQGGDAQIIGQRLLVLRRNLVAVIGALSEKVLQNKIFVDRSLKNIREVAEIMGQAVTGSASKKNGNKKSAIYTKNAQVSQAGDSGKGSLVERSY